MRSPTDHPRSGEDTERASAPPRPANQTPAGGTVAAFAAALAPDWRFPNDWFYWPPDLFALTSILLRQTGSYRYTVDDGREHRREWQGHVELTAHDWLVGISRCLTRATDRRVQVSRLALPDAVRRQALVMRRLAATVRMDELRALTSPDARFLCDTILDLHCLADQACAGFGLLAMPDPGYALVHCLANLILTARGSLSTLPKHHGIVLPKMRTPQSGLTLRSLSHHVSYHSTEVEVMWRSMPWVNVHENTINILAVPWPETVNEQYFRPTAETFEHVRYFSYERCATPASVDDLVQLVATVSGSVGRVHMIVLPELALGQGEYEELLRLLSEARARDRIPHVPMVVSGVSRASGRTTPNAPASTNEVRLAAYFAGRWYALSQSKHHRWKLTRSQVRQYSLEGRLATARSWYEHIDIEQRRLNFLAPTGWLALCPLICEDLAQLEPVSDIIRGVGPTLLIALLMDGPQLKDRWSARYASVFADDPGTAVLTLTSVGMAMRSHLVDVEPPRRSTHSSTSVALWKDQLTGWQTLTVNDRSEAVLLTISADWTEEFSADNRGDHQNAAAFKFEGSRRFTIEHDTAPLRSERTDEQLNSRWLGGWFDLRDLSSATYALDAAIELRGRHMPMILRWLLGRRHGRHERSLPRRLREIIEQLTVAQADPSAVGARVERVDWPRAPLTYAARKLQRWRPLRDDASPFVYWTRLAAAAREQLEQQPRTAPSPDGSTINWDQRRVDLGVPLAVLMAIHARVEQVRRWRPSPMSARRSRGAQPTWTLRDASSLLQSIEESLDRFAR